MQCEVVVLVSHQAPDQTETPYSPMLAALRVAFETSQARRPPHTDIHSQIEPMTGSRFVTSVLPNNHRTRVASRMGRPGKRPVLVPLQPDSSTLNSISEYA